VLDFGTITQILKITKLISLKMALRKKDCQFEQKYRPITNERENVYSKFLLMKSSKKYFNFSSASCQIILLMISPNNFEKKGNLKKRQLVFL
jgi:hypothetical protein